MINKFSFLWLSFHVYLGLSSFSVRAFPRVIISDRALLLLFLCFQRGVRTNTNSRGRNLWKLLHNDADKDAKRTRDARPTSPSETQVRSLLILIRRLDRTGTVVKSKHRQTVCCCSMFFYYIFIYFFCHCGLPHASLMCCCCLLLLS